VIIDDDVGSFRAPVIVVFVPPSIIEWAQRWRLSSAEIEMTAVLLRQQWRRQPDAAQDCRLLFSSLPFIIGHGDVKLLSEQHWQSLGLPSMGVDPMLESEDQAAERARALHRERSRRYYEAGEVGQPRFVRRRAAHQLAEHADWLVRVQVIGESPAVVARNVNRTANAVYVGLKRLAALLDLELRRLPRKGRPIGSRDSTPRRRRKNS
jgi:hypothetical protein